MYLFKELLKKKSKIITDEDNKEFKILQEIANKKKITKNYNWKKFRKYKNFTKQI